MTLRASFVWKNPDATRDLNERLKHIVQRGIVYGGGITPGVGLNVVVDPLVAVSFDGLTVVEDASQTLPVAASTTNYVVLWAKYNEGGSPATATLLWQVMDQATYLAHPEKDYLIVCGVVTLGAVVVVTLNDIDLTIRDEVDPLGRDWYRGKVATPAALPMGPPAINRIGDFYFVDSDNTFFFWNGTAWEALNTGSYNNETETMNSLMVRTQRNRITQGSGVIAGSRPGLGDYAAETEVPIVDTPTVADQIGIDSFSAIINGHYVEVHGQNVTLGAPPGVQRYDLIFLEAWRETITVPESHVYDRNPDGSSTYTIGQASDVLETIQWEAGIPSPPGDNFTLNEIDSDNHNWMVVKSRLAFVSNVPAAALYRPNDATVVPLALNIDGNPFSAPPAGSGVDDRVWMAPSATSDDGFSWAIPLVVINRVAAEVPPNAIQTFRSDGLRYVFPVNPVCDVDNAAKLNIDTVHRQEPTDVHDPWSKVVFDKPSGFLTGMDYQIETRSGAPANTVAFFDPNEGAKIRVRGFEDYFTLATSDIAIGAAPGAGWARTFLYLRMNVTMYADDPTKTNYKISPTHRPYIPSRVAGTNARGQGWKRGYVQYEVMVHDFGATDILDENDAMLALPGGWQRGDITVPPNNTYDDGGIWSRPISITEDNRVHPWQAEWAIPICLIHRRNSAAWALGVNENGTGVTRLDDRQDPTVTYPDDLVDLRRLVDVSPESFKEMIEEDMDKIMKGQLRTRMANKYLGGGTGGVVAGSRILQTDWIGNSAALAYDLPAQPDGLRKIWSDAREFHLVAASFDIAASSSVADLYDYVVAGNTGTLKIYSPPGAHIVRHIPSILYAVSSKTSPDYLDFYGPPCWTTHAKDYYSTFFQPTPCTAKYIDANSEEQNVPFWLYNAPGVTAAAQSGDLFANPFKVTTTDSYRHATEMTGYVDLSGGPTGTVTLSWWVHYDRSFVAPYNDNMGLAEIPDVVHAAIKGPATLAEQLNVGPLYVAIRKPAPAVGLTLDFTAADVTAATGLPGTVTLTGLDWTNIYYDSAAPPGISSYKMNHAQDTLTIEYAGAWAGETEVIIYFETTDVNKWIEVGRGGKSVQAYFDWYDSGEFDIGAVPPSTFARTTGNSIWSQLDVGGSKTRVFPQFWSRNTSGSGDWQLNTNATYQGSTVSNGYDHSNLISFDTTPMSAKTHRYVKVIAPQHTAPTNNPNDYLQISYTYTPYQGLSSDGGATAVPATAIPKLKTMLHGKVEANSDFYASQSGASSYFSGVDTWTGIPINNHNPVYDNLFIAAGDRFTEYNQTFSVRQNPPRGAAELRSKAHGEQYQNAAAILRLPFPTNPNMTFTGFAPMPTGTYHKGVMEFDLDPCRAGAGAGCWNYAPSYFGGPVADMALIRYDHFVNGLTRLSTIGSQRRQQENILITTDMYQQALSDPAAVTPYRERWEVNTTGTDAIFQASLRNRANDLVARTATQIKTDDLLEPGTPEGSGIWFYSPYLRNFVSNSSSSNAAYYLVEHLGAIFANSTIIPPLVTGTAIDLIFVTQPGTVHQFWKSLYPEITPSIYLKLNLPGGHDPGELYDTTVTTDSEFVANRQGLLDFFGFPLPLVDEGQAVDTIKVPFGSYSQSQQAGAAGGLSPLGIREEIGMNFTSGLSSLVGQEVHYPSNWSGGTITTLENYLNASLDLRGAGRGIYLGSTTQRINMPMLVPGTGTVLSSLLRAKNDLVDIDSDPPPRYPYMPGQSVFVSSNKHYYTFDHGGPIAYVCFGAIVNPTSNDHKGRAVLQISGGPTGMPNIATGSLDALSNTASDLDGTAIDAFWPSKRPLIPQK